MEATLPKRPVLTMPDAEAAAVMVQYQRAGVILEYGSGGSTVLAAELPGKTVFSVESDAKWLQGMQSWFAHSPPLAAAVHLHHARIGPTKAWGYPADEAHFRKWPRYAFSVWELPEFAHPDVVLIDGRFRIACFLNLLFRISRPVAVLWDDYIDRPAYHQVETLVRPAEMIGRMARFNLEPMAIPAQSLPWIIDSFLRPR